MASYSEPQFLRTGDGLGPIGFVKRRQVALSYALLLAQAVPQFDLGNCREEPSRLASRLFTGIPRHKHRPRVVHTLATLWNMPAWSRVSPDHAPTKWRAATPGLAGR